MDTSGPMILCADSLHDDGPTIKVALCAAFDEEFTY